MRVLTCLPLLLLLACNGDGTGADASPADLRRDARDADPEPDLFLAPDIVAPDGPGPCAAARQAVIDEMARINHCLMDGECTSLPGQCPFGCHIPYNTGESTATLKQLMADYAALPDCPKCAYGCPLPGPVHCQGGKCVMSSL